MVTTLNKHPLSPPFLSEHSKRPKSFRDQIEPQLRYPVPISTTSRRPPSFSPAFSAYKRKKKIQFRQRNRVEPQSQDPNPSKETGGRRFRATVEDVAEESESKRNAPERKDGEDSPLLDQIVPIPRPETTVDETFDEDDTRPWSVPEKGTEKGNGKAIEEKILVKPSNPRKYELAPKLELRRTSDGGFKTVVSGTGGYMVSPLDWSFYQGPQPYVDPNPNVKGKGKEGHNPQEDGIIDERPIKKWPTWNLTPDLDPLSDDFKYGRDDDAFDRWHNDSSEYMTRNQLPSPGYEYDAYLEDAESSPETESNPASDFPTFDAPLMSGALPPSPSATDSSTVSNSQIPNPTNDFAVVPPLLENRYDYIRPIPPYDPNILYAPPLEIQRRIYNSFSNRFKRWTKYTLFLVYRSLRLSFRWLLNLPSRPKWTIILLFLGYLIYSFLYFFMADYFDDTLESCIYALEDSGTWKWLAYLLASLTAKSVSIREDGRSTTPLILPNLATEADIRGTEAPTVITTQEKSLEDQYLEYLLSLETDTYPDGFRDLAIKYPEADIHPDEFWDPTTYRDAVKTAPISRQTDRSYDDRFGNANSYYIWTSEQPKHEGIPTYTTYFRTQSVNYTKNDTSTGWEEVLKTVTVTKTIGEWTYKSSVIGRSSAAEEAIWIVPRIIEITGNATMPDNARITEDATAASASTSYSSFSGTGNPIVAADLSEGEFVSGRLIRSIVTIAKGGEELTLAFVGVHTLTPEEMATTVKMTVKSSTQLVDEEL